MRGEDQRAASFFSYVRSGDNGYRRIIRCDRSASWSTRRCGSLSPAFEQAVRARRTAVDPAGAAVARAAAAGVLHGSLGAAF